MLFLAIDIANAVCAALLGLWMLIAFPRRRNAQLVALLCVAAMCHVVLARYDYQSWIEPAYRIDVGALAPVLNFARNSAPGLFMVLVHRLFAERSRPPLFLLGLFALQLFLEGPAEALLPGLRGNRVLTQLAPTLLQSLFAGFALYWTMQDWRADLVAARRRSRAVMLAILSVDVVASSVLLRVVIPAGTAANYDAHLVLSAINLAIVAGLLLKTLGRADASALLGDGVPSAAKSPPQAEDRGALARLNALLVEKHAYRNPTLSLAQLAAQVGIPEYRLRQLIHEALGQRNFNVFLHGYRIREACARLVDPSERRTPILTIALSVGYRSINTFNRGFREVTGMTPSAYRAQISPQKPNNAPNS